MRALVGILHCIENELDACLRALEAQTLRGHRHFIVRNLPNREAHARLYATFQRHAAAFDFFVKLDADMVLCRADFLERVAARFAAEPDTDELEIAVEDFYTGRPIYGLHAFRNTVRWTESAENVFVDLGNSARRRVYDDTDLAPAAWHSPDPSPFQAFHFGVHKAVKVLQLTAGRRNLHAAAFHWHNILRVLERWRTTRDTRLGLAALGARDALRLGLDHRAVDFASPDTRALFDAAQATDPAAWDALLGDPAWREQAAVSDDEHGAGVRALLRMPAAGLGALLGLRGQAEPARRADAEADIGVTIDGMPLRFSARSARARAWLASRPGGIHEPAVTAALLTRLEPGAVFLDVGCNIGFYTVLAGARGAEAHAFDIDGWALGQAARSVALNGTGSRTRLVHAAVQHRDGGLHAWSEERFHEAYGTAHLRAEPTPGSPWLVPGVTLDGYCAARGVRPTVVKIDVEGAEPLVLAGAAELLRDARPFLVLEVHPEAWMRGSPWAAPDAAAAWLRDLGYALYVLCDHRTAAPRPGPDGPAALPRANHILLAEPVPQPAAVCTP